MLLAFLIYLIQFLSQIKILFIFLAGFAGIAMFGTGIWWMDNAECRRDTTEPKKKMWKCFQWGIAFMVASIALPNERTAYLMAAGYTAQTIAESPASKEIGGKVLAIINQKLDGMVNDGMKEAQEAVQQAAKNAAKKVADEVTK